MSTVIDLSALGALGFSIQGDFAIDWAGSSVSEAGDINGDGFDDILIGALLNYGNADFGGAAYVIFGRPGGFGNIDLTNLAAADGFAIQGDADAFYAGQNLSSAGDINGDGFDDIIVSTVEGGFGQPSRPSAYVIFGKASGFGTIVLTELAPSDGFVIHGIFGSGYNRFSVAAAGDVNGDGFDDITIGAQFNNGTSGAAYVIFGKAGGFGTIDVGNLALADGFQIVGDAAGDRLGRSVSGGGDVNGDGFDDLIVGAYLGDDGGTDAGEGYVIFGKAGGFGTIDLSSLAPADGFIIQGDTAGDWAGFSVALAGDVNGDGFADLIVGAPHGGNAGGEAYVIFGHAGGFSTIDLTSLTPSQGFIIQGDVAGDNAGFSVSGAGDVNHDGFDDLIIGAPTGDDGGTDAGEAYVLFGRAGGFGTIDLTNLGASEGFVIQGDTAGDNAGFSVSGLGDINGDGAADVVIGAPFNGDGGVEAGKAYVIFGTPTAIRDARNDFNGDGRSDILWRNDSGAFSAWHGQANGGFVAIPNSDTVIAISWHVARAGDFNGDGRDDVLWRSDSGAFSAWHGQVNGGFVASPNSDTMIAASWHVVGAGDFDGDGRDDVLWRSESGAFSAWHGQADGGFVASANSNTTIGPSWSVVGTGDFNGDGLDDVLWLNDSGAFSAWLGQANGGFVASANSNTVIATSWQVDGTGDFNGDGQDDVVWRDESGAFSVWHGQADGGFIASANANALIANSWHVQPDFSSGAGFWDY